MKSSQRGETRRFNDIQRSHEDTTFNLGIIDEPEEEIVITSYYEAPKRVSAFNERVNLLIKKEKKKQLKEREEGKYKGLLINKTQLGIELGEVLERKPISRQTINSYTNGRVSPKIDVVIAMSEYFEVSCDYLLGLEDNPTKTDKYISDNLGLSQKSIDYLRSRKMNLNKIEKENKEKLNKISRKIKLQEQSNDVGTLNRSDSKELKRLDEAYSNSELDTKESSDNILDVINTLIDDMVSKDSKKVLFYLSQYLSKEGLEKLVGVDINKLNALNSKIIGLKQTFDKSNSDQTINEFRDSTKDILAAYDYCFDDDEIPSFTENARLKVYMSRIQIKLESLRNKINRDNAL